MDNEWKSGRHVAQGCRSIHNRLQLYSKQIKLNVYIQYVDYFVWVVVYIGGCTEWWYCY